jgi:hypothetical protein
MSMFHIVLRPTDTPLPVTLTALPEPPPARAQPYPVIGSRAGRPFGQRAPGQERGRSRAGAGRCAQSRRRPPSWSWHSAVVRGVGSPRPSTTPPACRAPATRRPVPHCPRTTSRSPHCPPNWPRPNCSRLPRRRIPRSAWDRTTTWAWTASPRRSRFAGTARRCSSTRPPVTRRPTAGRSRPRSMPARSTSCWRYIWSHSRVAIIRSHCTCAAAPGRTPSRDVPVAYPGRG